MLLVGTGGSSETQLLKALSLGNSASSELKTKLNSLITAVRSSSEGATVRTATAAWLHKDLQLLSGYTDDLKQVFESETSMVDFTDPKKATKTINDWVVRSIPN